MKDEICGKKLDVIRKSFFKGKIPALLIEIQASGEYSQEEFDKLKLYLATLQKRDEKLKETFDEFIPKIDVDEPDSVLDELNRESLSEAEVAELDKSKDAREKSVKLADSFIKGLFHKFYDKDKQSPTDDELMDLGFELLALDYYLAQDSIYKKRLYKKKIIDFERMGKQRKLAEDYAQTSIEYRDYELSERQHERVKEFLNFAKKRYHTM